MREVVLTADFILTFEALEEEVNRLRAGGGAGSKELLALTAQRDDFQRQLDEATALHAAELKKLAEALATAQSEAAEQARKANGRLEEEKRRRLAAEESVKTLTARLAGAGNGNAENSEVGPLKEDLAAALFDLETARDKLRKLRQDNNWLREELERRSGGGSAGAAGR